MAAHTGGCHCGKIRFRVDADLAEAIYCNCSICVKKGFLHWIVLRAEFELMSGADELISYRFNTGVAEHKFCRHCGIHAFYTPRSDPDKVDVNVRCLDDVDVTRLELGSFDGKNWEQAILSATWKQEQR
jgi:hypothetical protein